MRISDWSSDVCSSDLWCWARPRTTDALTGCRTSRPRGFPGPLCMGLRPGVPPIMAAVQPVYDDPFSGPDMTAPVRLIVGLGNPGPEYETTRHNAGFWVADHIADDLKASFSLDKSFFALVARARVDGQAAYLAKPITFMNRSGQAVGALARFYKLAPEEILVIHDELDFMPGTAKLKFGGGHAGHNGLRDIQ